MQKEFHVTDSGIKIGCAYIPPAKPLSHDEEIIQGIFINEPKESNVIHYVFVAVYVVAMIVMCLDFFIWRP